MKTLEEKHLVGCCGLYCGLCPRFQSKAPSRCIGCQLGEQHSYCSVYRCCVTKQGLFTCADCDEYPCERLLRVLGVEEGLDSFISHKPALPNLDRIREVGLETYLEEQRERREVASRGRDVQGDQSGRESHIDAPSDQQCSSSPTLRRRRGRTCSISFLDLSNRAIRLTDVQTVLTPAGSVPMVGGATGYKQADGP